jgi:hypothetical protein
MAPPRPSPLARARAWLRAGRLRPWLLGALVLAIAVRALLPFAAATLLERQASAQLGRVVEVGNIDFGFLGGRAAVERFAVGGLLEEGAASEPIDPEQVLLGFDRFALDWRWLPLLSGEIQLREVVLEGPAVRVIRGPDGRIVPLRVAVPVAEPEPEEPEEPDSAGAGLAIRLERLRITDLTALLINLAREGRPPVELALEELALSDFALEGDEIGLGSVSLRAPRLRVLRNADFGGLLGAADAEAEAVAEAEAQAAAAGAEAARMPQRRLLAWRVSEASVDAADFTLVTDDGELQVSLRVVARELRGAAGERFPLEISLGIAGGSVELAGDLGVSPLAFDGKLTWSDLSLAPLAAAAGDLSPARIASGTSSGALDLDFSFDAAKGAGGLGLALSGRAGVRGLDLALDDPDLKLAWSDLALGIESVALAADGPPVVALSELRIDSPRVEATRKAPRAPAGAGAAEAPGSAEAPEAAAPAADAQLPRIRVALLQLSDGRVAFDDPTVSPPHRSRIRGLEVRGSELRWPERRAEELTIRGRGPTGGSFRADAHVAEAGGRIELALDGVGLAPFSAYASDAAGYRLEDGSLTLGVRADLQGQRATLSSDVVLEKLAVDEVEDGIFQETVGVPLDVGLALLRDPTGGINLPVSMTFERGQAAVGLAGVLTGALRQALVGALSTPLKGLGMLVNSVGGGGALFEPIAVPAGELAPAGAEAERVLALAEMLEGRPSLGLRLRGRAGGADDPALAEQTLIAAVEEDADLPPVDAGFLQRRRLVGALEQRGRGKPGELETDDADALAAWVASVEVSDEQRVDLARRRAERLRDELVTGHGVAATRVAIGEPLAGDPAVVIELAPVASE